MFNSPVLDLVILLSFTYFIGSLILSTINEAIVNGLANLRKTNLKTALEGLIIDPKDTKDKKIAEDEKKKGWTYFVQNTLMSNPHIESLLKKAGEYPSCIPSANFISALVSVIKGSNQEGYTQETLTASIGASILPQKMKDILLDFAAQSQNDIKAFEAKIETFYTNAMDRATGWYKKKLRFWLLVIGFILSIALNIDTIKICKDAFADKNKLSQTAGKIAAQVPNITAVPDGATLTYNIKSSKGTSTFKSTMDTAEISVTIDKSKNKLNELTLIYNETTSNPFGYSGDEFKEQWRSSWGDFFIKLIGVLITAFALQLGADFWFGLLTKAVNIRGAGKDSDEKPKPKS